MLSPIYTLEFEQLHNMPCHLQDSGLMAYSAHTLQLFRQNPGASLVPTIQLGFLAHSPTAAHWGQRALSSSHPSDEPACLTGRSNDLTWIHLVADHFWPSMTGQLPCKLSESVVASGWRLKNSKASPLTGLTVERTNKQTSEQTQVELQKVDLKICKAQKSYWQTRLGSGPQSCYVRTGQYHILCRSTR